MPGLRSTQSFRPIRVVEVDAARADLHSAAPDIRPESSTISMLKRTNHNGGASGTAVRLVPEVPFHTAQH